MLVPFKTKRGRILVSIDEVKSVIEHDQYCDLVTTCIGTVSVEHTFEEICAYLNAIYNVPADEEEVDEGEMIISFKPHHLSVNMPGLLVRPSVNKTGLRVPVMTVACSSCLANCCACGVWSALCTACCAGVCPAITL